MKDSMKSYYMQVAVLTSHLSKAQRLKVGAIAVKDNRIISVGVNGTPSGWDNCCEIHNPDGTTVSKPEVLHAERNCLDKLARSHESGENASLFVTHSPCLECAKSIYGVGIKEVYFNELYRSSDGIDFLEKCKIPVIQISA